MQDLELLVISSNDERDDIEKPPELKEDEEFHCMLIGDY